MAVRFRIKEVLELFTTYEYKELLRTVEDYLEEQLLEKKVGFAEIMAFYNPARNEGVALYSYEPDTYVEFPNLDFPIANECVTVEFY